MIMRFTLFLILICLSLPLFSSESKKEEKEQSTVKNAVTKATSKVITFGKDLVGGLSEGVTDGRKGSEGSDGAIIVSNLTEMDESVTIKLLGVEQSGDSQVIATFAIKNPNNQPVRLINLRERGALLSIDKDGFATGLSSSLQNPDNVTVPENAAVKASFIFQGKEADTFTIRVWGREFRNPFEKNSI